MVLEGNCTGRIPMQITNKFELKIKLFIDAEDKSRENYQSDSSNQARGYWLSTHQHIMVD